MHELCILTVAIYVHFYRESPVGARETDIGGLNKQVTSSADNVTMLYSTVHVLSCVHPNCLLSYAANNTDRISEWCWFIITVSKHQ